MAQDKKKKKRRKNKKKKKKKAGDDAAGSGVEDNCLDGDKAVATAEPSCDAISRDQSTNISSTQKGCSNPETLSQADECFEDPEFEEDLKQF